MKKILFARTKDLTEHIFHTDSVKKTNAKSFTKLTINMAYTSSNKWIIIAKNHLS